MGEVGDEIGFGKPGRMPDDGGLKAPVKAWVETFSLKSLLLPPGYTSPKKKLAQTFGAYNVVLKRWVK